MFSRSFSVFPVLLSGNAIVKSTCTPRFSMTKRLLVCFLLVTCQKSPALAQSIPLPFGDSANPAELFEKMFGEDSEADRAKLEKIDVSFSEEQKFGQQIVDSALATLNQSDIRVDRKGRDVEYLQSLVATLQPLMRNKQRYKSIQVLIARSPRIDARSYPGGTLIFFDGLLDAVPNEAALVGIVGHELSHLDRGHQLLPIKRVKLLEKSFSPAGNGANFPVPDTQMAKLWARPFRPEDERDADQDGVAWSFAAGYDPREMAKVFQKKGAKTSPSNEIPWSTFFRSHPYDQERHAAILKQYKQLQRESPSEGPLFLGHENLKKRFSRKQEEDAAK